MDGLSEKVSQILNDPAQMSQIMELAKSFGVSPPDGGESASQATEHHASEKPDDATMLKLMGLLSEASRSGGKEAALFKALKPFVSPERCEKMDRAAEVAKLSHIASCALRSFGDKK